MVTPHIRAEVGEIAKTVILPGDPRRAEYIASTVLDNSKLVSDVRGILAFTGSNEGRPVTVMASGMGLPSVSIYATELYRFYGVERIVRVGTCGAWGNGLKVRDVVAAASVITDSAVAQRIIPTLTASLCASYPVLTAAVLKAEELGADLKVQPVFSSDYFYAGDEELRRSLAAIGAFTVEMESAGLYSVALREQKEALTLLTVSDHFDGSGEDLTAAERETCFDDMVRIALGTIKE